MTVHPSGNKVKVGFFSFTEITDPGEHHSYNEWHQLDHMPEQFPLDGIAYGQRWVSTPACRAARRTSSTPLDAIHYMTLYLMTEPLDRTLREFMQLGRDLHAADRFHHHRRSHLSGPFRLVDSHVAPRILISKEAVPYRPNRGISVVVRQTGRGDRAASLASLCAVAGVAGAWRFADDAREITVAWLDDDPLAVELRLPSPEGDGLEFAGPFETITPWEWNWFDAS
jgi:hypothetical protein